MILVTIINIIAILLTYLSRYRKCRCGFEIAIILLICFYGIRYNYGNDYPVYLLMFNEINSFSTVEYSTESSAIERGWIFLNRLFAPFGFFSLVICLTIFQFFTIYKFIKRYVSVEQYYISLFFYLFSSGLMLTMLSMMRQCVAMNIILWSIPFIVKKKYWYSLPLIYLAAQFHQSAYIMLFLPFTMFLFKLKRNTYIIISIFLFFVLFIADNFVAGQINNIVGMHFDKYNAYIEEGSKLQLGSGIGFLFNILFFMILVLFDRHKEGINSWLLKMFSISYMFIPLSFIVPLVGRIGTYLSIMGVVGILPIIDLDRQKRVIQIVISLFVFITLYGYITFFYSDVWRDAFMEYHTIFESMFWQ